MNKTTAHVRANVSKKKFLGSPRRRALSLMTAVITVTALLLLSLSVVAPAIAEVVLAALGYSYLFVRFASFGMGTAIFGIELCLTIPRWITRGDICIDNITLELLFPLILTEIWLVEKYFQLEK